MNAPDTAVVPKNPVAAALTKSMSAMRSVLPSHITPERMSRIAMGMLRTNKKLAQTAMNNPESFAHAIVLSSQLGLEPGVLGMSYLVPYGNEVQMIPGYQGLIELARRSGEITSINTHIAYEHDELDLTLGVEPSLIHKPKLDGDRGRPVLVYCVARFKDGGHHLEWMSITEVNRIRDTKSKASKSGPWVDDYDEMVKKTVVRRASKYWPKSIEFANALMVSDAADQGQKVSVEGDFVVVEEPTEPEKQFYPAEQFAKDLPGWRDLIEKGKKTADQIIAMAETKNPLTDEQKAEIRKPIEPTGEMSQAEIDEARAREKKEAGE